MTSAAAAPLQILMLEDNALDAELIREQLVGTALQHRVTWVQTERDFRRELEGAPFALILADYVLPSFDGISALAIARELAPDTPFIFVSGTLGEELAVEALKNGATDYVVKFRLERLPRTVLRALSEARARAARREAERAVHVLNDALAQRVGELQAAERHLRLMVNELNHRVKNSLATIQAIAAQSFRGDEPLPRERAAFMARVIALSKAHDVLTSEKWAGADLADVVDAALLPLRDKASRRFRTQGPRVWIEPRLALSTAMLLHELSTNAVKYGALSNDDGVVEIDWTVQPVDGVGARLDLRWRESGGPAVDPPRRQGFGSRLLASMMSAEAGGRVELEYPRTGVVCVLEAIVDAPSTPELQPEAALAAP